MTIRYPWTGSNFMFFFKKKIIIEHYFSGQQKSDTTLAATSLVSVRTEEMNGMERSYMQT